MRIKLAIPDHLLTPEAIEAALEATTLANEQAMLRGEIPDVREAIARGVKWQPEPYTDGEHFDLGHEVARRKWGDCDDLGPWLAASLRASGEDPGARPVVYQSGPERYHVVTELSDGQILDPSRWAGMGRRSAPSNPGVSGAIATPFAPYQSGALVVAKDPRRGLWRARADVPFGDSAAHLACHGYARTPEAALDQAIAGAVCCGDLVNEDALDRLCGVGEYLIGAEPEYLTQDQIRYMVKHPFSAESKRLRDKYGKGGSILGTLAKPLAKLGRTLSKAGALGKIAQAGFPFLATATTAARVASGDPVSPADIMGAFHTMGPIGAEQFTKLANQYVPGSKAFMDAAAKQLSKLSHGQTIDVSEAGRAALGAALNYAGAGHVAEQVMGHLDELSATAGGGRSALRGLTRPHGESGPAAQSLPFALPDGTPTGENATLYYHPGASARPVVVRF